MSLGKDLSLKSIMSHLTSTGIDKIPSEPFTEAKNTVTRNDLVAKLISTFIGLAASFTITYFGVKWLVNAMDPTRKEKQQAKERVRALLRAA